MLFFFCDYFQGLGVCVVVMLEMFALARALVWFSPASDAVERTAMHDADYLFLLFVSEPSLCVNLSDVSGSNVYCGWEIPRCHEVHIWGLKCRTASLMLTDVVINLKKKGSRRGVQQHASD